VLTFIGSPAGAVGVAVNFLERRSIVGRRKGKPWSVNLLGPGIAPLTFLR
jgi:hypothetical protein